MKKQNKIYLGIGIVAIILIAAVAMFSAPKGEETIKIGVTSPSTGPVAVFGMWAQRGLEIAQEEINSQGGINEKNIELIFEDDQCTPGPAVTNTNKLIEVDNSKILISVCSATTPSVATTAEGKATVFSPVAFSKTVVEESYNHVFTPQSAIEKEMKKLANYAYTEMNLENVSIMYVNNELGLTYKEAFLEAFKAIGGNIPKVETFGLIDKDFRTQLTKIKETDSDGIVIVMSSVGLGNIVNQVKELNMNNKLLGTTISESHPFIQTAGTSAEGFVYTYPLKMGETDQSVKYRTKYFNKYEEEPEMIGTASYDILYLLKDALESCPEQRIECINSEMRKISGFEGAGGTISVNSEGMADKEIYIKQVEDGKFTFIE